MSTHPVKQTETVAGGLLVFLDRLWASRVFLLSIMIPALIFAVVVALLLPPRYEATATMLPNIGQRAAGPISGGLGSLANLAGVSIGGPGVDLYPVVGRSRRILGETLRSEFDGETIAYHLNKGSEPDSLERYVLEQNLRSALSFNKDIRSESLSLRYQHRNPELAVSVVNSVVFGMEAYFSDRARTQASEELELTRHRLREVSEELTAVEEDLLGFRQRNRNIERSPGLQLQEARLVREVEYRNRIYLELASQQELIKIREAAVSGMVVVLDHATLPMVKAWPRRSHIVVVIVGLAFALAALWVQIRALRDEAGSDV